MTAVEYLKQQYIERGETLPSGVFQEALEMEQKQMNIEYISNSDVITTIYNILYKEDTSNKESCLQLAEEITVYIKQLLKLAEEN